MAPRKPPANPPQEPPKGQVPPPLPEVPENPDQGEKGDKGDKGNQGNRGNPGPPGSSGSNLDVLKALGGLGQQVDKLDKNVDDEREARLLEKKSRDRQANWFKGLIAVGLVLAGLAIGGVVGNYNNGQNDKKESKKQDQIQQGALAGVCGITNVNRISIQNMLAEMNATKPIETTAKWDAFYNKWHADFAPIECRALVSPEVGLQLCLLYPPSLDPKTGKPTETTIDPLNKKNCPESSLPSEAVTTTTVPPK